MKLFTILAASVVIFAEIKSVTAMKMFLEQLPNGNLFSQPLGHPGSDSSKFTPLATAFENAGLTWTTAFCKSTFPGASMTVGAAFGDPCCTWKKGGKPDFTVTAFTTKPEKATVCASGGGGSPSTPAGSKPGEKTTPAPTKGGDPNIDDGSDDSTPSPGGKTGLDPKGKSGVPTPPTTPTPSPPKSSGCGVKGTRKFRH